MEWVSIVEEKFSYNDMCEIIRNESSDLAEDIELIDSFFNKKVNKQSLCYRIYYRSHERNLVNTVHRIVDLSTRKLIPFKIGFEMFFRRSYMFNFVNHC